MKTPLLFALVLFLFSCGRANLNHSNAFLEDQTPETLPPVSENLVFLNHLNTEYVLYRGTPKHLELQQSERQVPYTMTVRTDLMTDPEFERFADSVRLDVGTDSVTITRLFYAKGSCLILFPYINYRQRGAHLVTPELVSADLQVQGQDSMIVEESCRFSDALVEYQFVLPKWSLPLAYMEKTFFDEYE